MNGISHQYFQYAGLSHETVTLFVALSGRESLWPEFAAYLQRQTWPHHKIRLILLDTSQNEGFGAQVRSWISSCDYEDVRHVCYGVSRSGLADDDRYQDRVQDEVRAAVARIYNRLAREVTTDYAWIIEDDILPPDDACESLLRGFDADTASVSGVYVSRYDGKPCVWDQHLHHYLHRGHELRMVFGNGFGCVVLRGGVLRKTVFQGTGDFDRVFYKQVHSSALKAKVDWRVNCQHRTASGALIVPRDVGEDSEMDASSEKPTVACECTEAGWCERHQCMKTEHWLNLCRHRPDYFQLWEEGRGPGQAQSSNTANISASSQEPGLIQKAVNFGRAVARHVADRGRKVSDEIYDHRLAVCRECDSCDVKHMVCREPKCGCQLHVKARWHSEDCPLHKWDNPDIQDHSSTEEACQPTTEN